VLIKLILLKRSLNAIINKKNLKFKVGKLALKFISLFKIYKYIKELIYKLDLLNIYNYLYFTFYISLLKKYIAIKG
jgi:hypothetical protein